MRIHQNDNMGLAQKINANSLYENVKARNIITAGHKKALTEIKKREEIRKYN